MKRNALNSLPVFLLILLLPSLAEADTIVMKNGNTMDGIILKETPTEITLSLGVGTVTLRRSQIASIRKSDAQGASELKDDWQQHYFAHEKYVPKGLEGLASGFRSLESQRNAAFDELERLRSPTSGPKSLQDEMERLRQESVDCMRRLPPKIPPSDGKHNAEIESYNALIERHNALRARMEVLHDEIVKAYAADDKRRKHIAAYLQILLNFQAMFEARIDHYRKNGGTKQEGVFFTEMAKRMNAYSHEIKETDVPFEAADRHAIITARINNRVDARLLLDTGASVVQISQALAQKLNLDLTDKPMVKVTLADGRESEVKAVMLDSVQVADALAEGVAGIVSPSELSHGVDGLLGMSFLQGFDVRLDGFSNKLILKRFDPKQ